MEHRCAPRFDMQVNVVVHLTGTTLVNGVTTNISPDGVCLRLKEIRGLARDSVNRIKRNQLVRVALNAGTRLVIMPALVLRSREGTVALVFSDEAPLKKQALRDFLYGDREEITQGAEDWQPGVTPACPS